jgi:hypothetical protein
MSNPVWPSLLPQYVEVQGFSETLPKNRVQNQPEAGPPKSRRRFTSAPEFLNCSIVLKDAATVTVFKTFYKDTLVDGSLKFDWVRPIEGTSCEMTFIEEPKITAIGPLAFRATMRLIIWP